MIERDLIVTTKHGQMPSFLVAPDGPASHPAVIFYMDAPGIREELHNMCRRITKHGYVCLLPDMYYRIGMVRFDIPRRDDGMSAVIRAAMNHLSNALVTDDTAAMIGFLDTQDAVKPGPIGCVGHCMSYITTAAAQFPRMVAAASLYGVGIVTEAEDSPTLLLNDVKGELYYAFAEHDQSVPPTVIPALKSALEKAGTKRTLEVYPGTHHGFCFPERAVYDTRAAEATWQKIFALWDRRLK
jgi:carboxymethylenebutenolidase